VVYLLLRLYSVGGNVWRSFGMIVTGKSNVIQENHVSVLNHSQQNPHTLVWDRTKPSVVIIWEMLTKTSSIRRDALSFYEAHGFTSHTSCILKDTLVHSTFLASLQLLCGKIHDRGYRRCLLFSALCRFTGSLSVLIYRHVCFK